jgi:hypothetical protein
MYRQASTVLFPETPTLYVCKPLSRLYIEYKQIARLEEKEPNKTGLFKQTKVEKVRLEREGKRGDLKFPVSQRCQGVLVVEQA